MKKTLLWLVMVVIIFSMVVSFSLIGCKEKVAPAEEEVATEEAPAELVMEEYTFGLSLWANSDPLSQAIIRNCEFAAGVLGSKYDVAVDGFEPDNQVSNVENFIAKGVDAIAICPCTNAVVAKLVELCDEAEIPLTLAFRKITDPDIKDFALASDYYLGNSHEDEGAVGYSLGEILAEKGCKNVGIINYNHGDTTAEARYAGYVEAFDEFGVNIVAEQWEILTADKAAAAVESFIAAFPELDGVAVVGGGGGPLEGAITAIKNNNKLGEILVTGCDFGPDLLKNLQNQEVAAMSGGHWVDPFYTFILSYNYVSGTPLSDKAETITLNPLFIKSEEEATNYEKWCKGDVLPYTAEEIKNMIVSYNPDFTLDDLKGIASKYSLEDVMTRHEGLVE